MHVIHSILRDPDPSAAGGGGAATAQGAAAGTGAAAAAGAGTAAAQGASGGGGASGAGQAAATPPPFYKGLYGDDGKIDKAALDRLPDHLKPYKDVYAKYETVDALLSGFGNAHAMASKKGLTPIDATAPDHVKAERKALLDQALNVPKDPKGYGIARPNEFPEEFWHQDGADKFAALAHKHSLSPDAVKEILGLQLEMTNGELAHGKEMETAYFRSQDEAFAKAARETGMDLTRATELATRGAGVLGIDPKSPVFKSADMRLACLRATALVSEDKLPQGGDGAGLGKPDYISQARDIMNNPQNPMHKAWNNSADPRHDDAVERVNQLYRMHKG